MAKTNKVPAFVHVGNAITLTLLRIGLPLMGPYIFFGNYPMYLLTVRGRKSGLPRTVAVAIMERGGQRYVGSPYGIVDWVRNLRAAGEALLTRSRHAEPVKVKELPQDEAALFLQEQVKKGNPFTGFFGVNVNSSFDEFQRAVLTHPIFMFEGK